MRPRWRSIGDGWTDERLNGDEPADRSTGERSVDLMIGEEVAEFEVGSGGGEPGNSLGESAGNSTGVDEGSYISCNGLNIILLEASSGIVISSPGASATNDRSPGYFAFSFTHSAGGVSAFCSMTSGPPISYRAWSKSVSSSALAKPFRTASAGSTSGFLFLSASSAFRRLFLRFMIRNRTVPHTARTTTTTTATTIPIVLPEPEDPPALVLLDVVAFAESVIDLIAIRFCCMLSLNTHCEIEKLLRSQSTNRYLIFM